MSGVLLLAPYRPNDEVLRRSRWVAGRNAERLRREGHDVEEVTGDACAGRIGVPPASAGVAFFGHGQEDMVQGSDERPLFGGDAAAVLQDRWFHAFACDAAAVLGQRLIRVGAAVFVGYDLRLSPRWDEAAIPAELAGAFEEVVTCVTAALAEGATSRAVLRERLRLAVEAVTLWSDDHPGESAGLRLLSEQLLQGLRVLPSREHR